MAMSETAMPEGTNSIIDDAEGTGNTAFRSNDAPAGNGTPTGEDAKSAFADLKQSALDSTADLRAQASEKAWSFADQGKARAGDALQNLARMVGDAAAQVDEKVGPQYGDYARKAADAVTGAAEGLQNKSVDELVEDAKSAVRNSPAIAIGIAAALGFVIARLARSGAPATEERDA